MNDAALTLELIGLTFGSLGPVSVAVVVLERLKQESMYGLSAGTKKSGLGREVAVSGVSTVYHYCCVKY